MGALWDFIAGKSTDWDTVEAEQAVQSSIDKKNRREERRIQENIRYYCKLIIPREKHHQIQIWATAIHAWSTANI